MTLSRLSALAAAAALLATPALAGSPSPVQKAPKPQAAAPAPVKAVGTPATRSVGASPAKPGDPTYRYDMYYSDLLDARTKRG